MHARAQIRNALAAALATLPGAPRLYVGANYPIDSHLELPAVCLYTRGESVDLAGSTMGAPVVVRDLEVEIVGVLAADDTDDLADELAEAIEAAVGLAIEAGGALGGLVRWSGELTTAISGYTETDRAIRLVTVGLTLNYRTPAWSPAQLLTI